MSMSSVCFMSLEIIEASAGLEWTTVIYYPWPGHHRPAASEGLRSRGSF